jgi:hypothetical protein
MGSSWSRVARGGLSRARGDDGSGTLEYVGVAVLVGVLVAALLAAGFHGRLQGSTSRSVCKVTTEDGCADGSGADEPGAGGQGDGSGQSAGQDGGCHGFWGCAGSALYNVGKGAYDDVAGMVHVVTDPGSLVDAAGYIASHPLDSLRQLVWDDESAEMADRGDTGGAIGRTVWNVGSWFIPFYDIGKAGSKLGKLGKLGRLGKLGKVAEEAAAFAERAAQLARKGDLAGAQAAARRARQIADDAAAQARKAGCLLGAPPTRGRAGPGLLVLAGGGGGRLSTGVVVPAGTVAAGPIRAAAGCGEAADAAKKAAQQADAAEKAARGPVGFAEGLGQTALTPGRLQHGTKNLTKSGVLPPWSGKNSPGIIKQAFVPILEHPAATFDHTLGGTSVRGFLGEINGQQVAVFVYKEGPYKGQLASSSVPSANQLKMWGITP